MSDVRLVFVAEDDANIRLDRWFKRHFPTVKHGRLEKLLRTGQIRVDGHRAKGSTRLEPGQSVRVPPLGEAVDAPGRQRATISEADRGWIRLLVIHEDGDVIALNKPPGIAVQGGRKVTRHIDGLLDALAPKAGERPRLVHRLDRDTGGVLLLARRASSAAALTEAFRARDAKKTYWAIVAGAPPSDEGTIDFAIAKKAGPGGFEKMAADLADGKDAVTDYRVLERAGRRAAWVELRPRTGRTHQLRIHCASLGTPILGDRKYGGATAILDGVPGGDRLALHAREINIAHPSGGRLIVSAEIDPQTIGTFHFFGFYAASVQEQL